MTKTRKLVRDLLSLINKSQLNDQQTTKIKNLICYLSEARKNNELTPDDIALVENTLFFASMKLRTFGYNRLNGLVAEKIENDPIDFLRDECIAEYYKTETGFVLDRMQKLVLDTFESENKKLFLKCPYIIWKDLLIERNYLSK